MGERCGEDGDEKYCRTRHEATEHVRARLRHHVTGGRRVLVGFDFPYGYPAGLAARLGLSGAPWRAVWDTLADVVQDTPENASNRFAAAGGLNRRIGPGPGPFWGCPASQLHDGLTSRAKGLIAFPFGDLAKLRRTEAAIAGVQETWKLSGAGSVGSQALTGIPRVRALRDDPQLAAVSRVWPFETGFTARPVPDRGPFVLHAEIWPGIVPAAEVGHETATTGAIKDQAQVRLMCRWAARHDADGALGAFFADPGLAPPDRARVDREEGWILGVALPAP